MIDVSCALIINQHKYVLVAQRSASMRLPLKWEFPGGKVEPGETAAESLVREIKEELGVVIKIVKAMNAHVFDDGQLAIRLIPFQCEVIAGEIKLAEHATFLWLPAAELAKLDWAEADLPVLRDYLNTCLN